MRRSSKSLNGSANEETGDEKLVEQLKDFVELKKFFREQEITERYSDLYSLDH